MIPSWYDVLGVDADATIDEIRTAWQESVSGLDPTDRRFKQRNRAAEVLLDDQRRAAHDADLAAQDEVDELDDIESTVESPTVARDRAPTDKLAKRSGSTDDIAPTAAPQATGPRRSQMALTIGLGVVALLLVLATIVALVASGRPDKTDSAGNDTGLPNAREVAAARAAAITAIGPVLSYDYRDLDKSKAAATSFMTERYADEYDQQFTVIADNAPKSQTIVTAEVVDSGIVRTGKARVDILVFVNRPTRNVAKDQVSRDQVTVRMLDVDGAWLVDCLITAPGGTCGE